MQLNPLERRMSNIRLVPKVVLLMVFSTLLLLAKLWYDASNLEATLLSEGIDAAMANTIADRLLWTGLVETALMGVVFVVLLLTGSRLMVKQVHYLVGLLERFANKDLSHSVLLKSRDGRWPTPRRTSRRCSGPSVPPARSSTRSPPR